jgi:NTP pyrophosphatase (non-canonical NTP hydrolase)
MVVLMETYSDMVGRLKKDGAEILATLTAEQADAIHMVLGISGEAGELVDAVKKWAIYRKELDYANVIEELGDLMFYMEGLMQNVGVTRKEVEIRNQAKLGKRYEKGYSDKAAQERADKAV